MQNRKVTYKIYPNKIQENKFCSILKVHQKLYNKALEQRITAYKEDKIYVSFKDQCKNLTEWRAADPELGALNAQSEQVTLKRLDLAFKHFFRRVKNGETPGFPRFKSFDRFKGWGYKTHGDGFKLFLNSENSNGYVRISGVGVIQIRGKSRNLGSPKTAEIVRKSDGWYLSVTIKCNPKRKRGTAAISFDWGLENFITVIDTDNNINKVSNPRFGRQFADKIKLLQRKIAKSKKQSNNRKKIIQKLKKAYHKLSEKRVNFIHTVANNLINKSSLITTEELDIKNMTRKGGVYKKGLNREILNTTPAAFIQLLKCKAEEAGIYWFEIPTKKVKPTQTCHGCGRQEKKNLAERQHQCQCGVKCSRDENAAKVILNWTLFSSPTGQKLSEVWSTDCLDHALKHKTPSVINA